MLNDETSIHPLFRNLPATTEKKILHKRIVRNMRETIKKFGMVEGDSRWLVCLSGEKDSYRY